MRLTGLKLHAFAISHHKKSLFDNTALPELAAIEMETGDRGTPCERNGHMATIEYRDPEHDDTELALGADRSGLGPTRDFLGICLFLLQFAVCFYLVLGWLIPSAAALFFYLAFLPAVAMLWQVNRGDSVIGNIETLLRTGRWRDPRRAGGGRFIGLVLLSALRINLPPSVLDAFSHGGLVVLWVLAFRHLSVLGEPALLSLFP